MLLATRTIRLLTKYHLNVHIYLWNAVYAAVSNM